VAKHGGRIVKTTGDGVLLEFPSVVDAVECAVAVQAVMAERNEGVPADRLMLPHLFRFEGRIDHSDALHSWRLLRPRRE
jgi:class 3 adenylate cyclase